MKKLLFATAVLAATIASNAISAQAVEHSTKAPALEVTSFRIEAGPAGLTNISGTAANRSGKAITTAFITFKLYDASGAVIGDAITTQSNLSATDTWAFVAQTGVHFARAEVSRIDTY